MAPNQKTHMSSADDTLKAYVDEMIYRDKRFTGMSRYIFNINFYWSSAISTACAGHGFIFFNPEFWDKLNEEKKKTVIAHEIWHLILDHLKRGEGFDQSSYNIAADHVINNTLQEDGFVMGPDEYFGDHKAHCNPAYKNLSTNEVYAKVHQERKKDPDKHKPIEGTPSNDQIEQLVREALQGTGKDLQQQIDENEVDREIAAQAGKNAGYEAGSQVRILQTNDVTVFIQQAPYEVIFKDYLTDPLSGGKRTFMRPSRRQIRGGLRLKGKFPKRGKANRLTHLVYALDVSGSISTKQAQQFLRSAETLKKTLNPVRMTVILWDTSIVFEKTYGEQDDLSDIRVRAGGGTRLEPVYSRVKQLNPEAVVIFTDLCVSIPPKPDTDVIWLVTDMQCQTSHVPYGDIYLIPEANQ